MARLARGRPGCGQAGLTQALSGSGEAQFRQPRRIAGRHCQGQTGRARCRETGAAPCCRRSLPGRKGGGLRPAAPGPDAAGMPCDPVFEGDRSGLPGETGHDHRMAQIGDGISAVLAPVCRPARTSRSGAIEGGPHRHRACRTQHSVSAAHRRRPCGSCTEEGALQDRRGWTAIPSPCPVRASSLPPVQCWR